MRRPPSTGPRRSRLLRCLVATVAGLVLVALLGLGFVQLSLTTTASTAAATAVSLLDDDHGAALFAASDLTPGRPDTACVGLTAEGSRDPGTEVRLSADGQAGDLAPYLLVSVDRGTVPAGGDCVSFSGGRIWSGTLAEVPASDVRGIATGWHPAVEQRSVYRFTVTLLDDPRAQGLQASASFRWSLTEALPEREPDPDPEPEPSPVPEPSLEPEPSAVPEPSVVPAPAPAPTVVPVTDAAVGAGVVDPRSARPTTAAVPSPTGDARTTSPAATSPAPTPVAPTPAAPTSAAPTSAAPTSEAPSSGTGGPSGPGGSDVVEAPPLESGPVAAVSAAVQAAVQAAAEVVAKAAQQVGETAVAVAHDGQFPVALVGVVAAFLFLQGRMDRRDPKLALARVREELSEYRDFPAPPTTETT